MSTGLSLPLIDLSSPDRAAVAESIRQACIEYGFFYVINHGIGKGIFQKVFEESKKFFSLPLEGKMKLKRNDAHRGYTPLYAETLDTSTEFKGNFGDLKESIYIGGNSQDDLNQWPSEESLPLWKDTMQSYHQDVLSIAKRLASLIALSLNLDDNFFERIGAWDVPEATVRLLHYPGELSDSDDGKYGASAHSDYGIITLLATDGVPGLQACLLNMEKDIYPQLWENVHHVDGAFIVNVGDLLERWTNCLFRSTLHRVLAIGKDRYSVAFFLDPNPDCLVECLESCCSDSHPPRYRF
ncbi:2OG-Fe(II) oxygenase superfamily [Musa troglodytarum]|uniref:2OG-Fe(II) oxygenase superfamily n=1 Tax=Musa troglodytarum TaxID=320322 RepID=A0A9E7HM43_9LILI|nr:2OG-Fe(II) oxygenase superfamily [Musa troglodytarum]